MTDHEAAVAIFRACKGHDPVLPPSRTTVDVEARDERHAKAMAISSPVDKPRLGRPPVEKSEPTKAVPSRMYPPRQHALAHAMWNIMRDKKLIEEDGRCLLRSLVAAYNKIACIYQVPILLPGPMSNLLKGVGFNLLRGRLIVCGQSGRGFRLQKTARRFIRTRIGIELEGE